MDFEKAIREIVEAGKFLGGKGWVPATSGNFSVRLPDGMAITVSGADKGKLSPEWVMKAGLSGNSLDGRKPSAETLLHSAIYSIYPSVGAILHTHSQSSVVLTKMLPKAGEIRLRDYEILKALSGITTHEAMVILPVFDNTQDMKALSAEVLKSAGTHGFLIRGHGLYSWGRDMEEALRSVEAIEFILECEIRLK